MRRERCGSVHHAPPRFQREAAISYAVMRFMFALFAILGLLVSPVTASAAQVACNQGAAQASQMMDMPGMAVTGMDKTSSDPCCNHSSSHKMDQKSCVQACANACAVTAALPGPTVSSLLLFSTAQLTPARLAWAHPHEPTGLRRPPKLMG